MLGNPSKIAVHVDIFDELKLIYTFIILHKDETQKTLFIYYKMCWLFVKISSRKANRQFIVE